MLAQSKSIKREEKFAEGLCFKKLFFVFLVGSFIGTIYEDVLIYISSGIWMTHRGVIYGPFNVIYGFGAVIMIWVLLRKPLKNWQIVLYGALLGGVVEYVVGFLQEFFTHTVSWDYSDYFLNIGGRTTIPYMLVWGLLGLILVRVVYPFVSKIIEAIPVKIGNTVYIVLVVFMAANMLISWTAIIRQTLRHNNVSPFTPIGRFCDEYYTDDFLKRYFPNMQRHD